MSNADEEDSRTALVGIQWSTTNSSDNSLRRDSEGRHLKKQKRMGSHDTQGFVPKGSTAVDPLYINSDSASCPDSTPDPDPDRDHNCNHDYDHDHGEGNLPEMKADGNEGSRTEIPTAEIALKDDRFNAVNTKYWRCRSDSASEDRATAENVVGIGEFGDIPPELEPVNLSDGTEDSDSLDLDEMDDSIVLNIGLQDQEDPDGRSPIQTGKSDPRSHRADVEEPLNDTHSGAYNSPTGKKLHAQSKEEALLQFSDKYPTAPLTLVDLNPHDFEIQARYLYFDRDTNDIDLNLPITCTECLQEGHLAEICPSKECVHCGAWGEHQSSFCLSWRRCQRCRGRGHGKDQCTEVIRNDMTKMPCDLCGLVNHKESECDHIWKFPQKAPKPGPVLVSVSCANCTSNRHLIGDCPSLQRSITFSSWTLKAFEPETIININSVTSGRNSGRSSRGQREIRIRGRADQRSPSPSSDDLVKPRNSLARRASRSNIQIGRIGRAKSSRGGPQISLSAVTYRDRQDIRSDSTRQRSLSPIRGRGNDTRRPPLRAARGSERGRGGRGVGSKRGGNGETYRPLPSAGKKAWDRFRL